MQAQPRRLSELQMLLLNKPPWIASLALTEAQAVRYSTPSHILLAVALSRPSVHTDI